MKELLQVVVEDLRDACAFALLGGGQFYGERAHLLSTGGHAFLQGLICSLKGGLRLAQLFVGRLQVAQQVANFVLPAPGAER